MKTKPQIESLILTIRGQKVILDTNLAQLYGVATKRLNEQVKRNEDRFPDDFIFQLSASEIRDLKVTKESGAASQEPKDEAVMPIWSQNATTSANSAVLPTAPTLLLNTVPSWRRRFSTVLKRWP